MSDRTADLITWTIRSRLERYNIRFLPIGTLDIENLAEEIAATLRDPPVEFRDVGAAEYTRLGHYVSTYCIHDDHEHCRLTCKTCGVNCRCSCHTDDPIMGSEHDRVVDRNAAETHRPPCECGHDYDDHTSGVAVGCDAMDVDSDEVCSCTRYRPDGEESRDD